MSSNFASWENDPFFAAAEQVQDSADRLESAYRALIHAKSLSPVAQGNGSIEFHRRKLGTAFGIAKWQLEEFEKEVAALTPELHLDDIVLQRHQQFVEAINYQLSSIKDSLLSSKDQMDRKILASVSLGQKESDELAHFLSGSQIKASSFAVDSPSSRPKAEMRYHDMATSPGSLSTSSGMDGRKGMFGSLDECTSCQETCTSSSANDRGLSRQTWMLEGNHGSTRDGQRDVDKHDSGGGFAATALFCEDLYDDVNMCIERVHGESWTGMSTDVGLSHYNDTGESRMPPRQVPRGFLTQMWPSFFRAGLYVGSGVSQSVLKRLKDGESDPLDLCQMCDDDIEANCGTLLCQRYSGSPELQTLRSSQKILRTRQLVQKIIVVLAALVILCLFLY